MEATLVKESQYVRSLIEASLDPLVTISAEGKITDKVTKLKCIDLDYLIQITKSDSKLMMEMIYLYLEQTPALISLLKSSLYSKDWNVLRATAHKIIPSFSIMGISADFEKMAIKIQDYATSQYFANEIPELVIQLDNICTQACMELEEAVENIKRKETIHANQKLANTSIL